MLSLVLTASGSDAASVAGCTGLNRMRIQRGATIKPFYWTVADYERARAKCTWVRDTSAVALTSIPAWDLKEQHSHSAAGIQLCTLDVRMHDADAILHIARLGDAKGGPLEVRPGGWYKWNLSVPLPHRALDPNTSAVKIAATRFWPVYSENGINVPNPPLHNHHAVQTCGKPPASAGSLLRQLAGNRMGHRIASAADSACHTKDGGMECIMSAEPRGSSVVCTTQRGRVPVQAIVNDVRPRGSTMDSYAIFYEVAWTFYKATSSPTYAQLRATIKNLWTMPTMEPAPAPKALNSTMFLTFVLPAEAPSVTYREYTMPGAGQILASKWHGHHEAMDEGFVFAGSLRNVMGSLGVKQLPHSIQSEGAAQFKKALLYGAARARAMLLCRYLPRRESVPPVPGLPPQEYDRKALPVGGHCSADGHRFRAGDTVTVACISKQPPHGPQVFHQHCSWSATVAAPPPM